MIGGLKVAVVLPAYNAAKTLRQTIADIPADVVDDLILTDDCSTDDTIEVATELGLHVIVHDATAATAPTRRAAIRRRSAAAPTSSSCSIRIINIRRSW